MGTFYILTDSVVNLESREDQLSREELGEEFGKLDEQINTTLETFNFEGISEEHTKIDAAFEEYEGDLKDIRGILNSFELPISSPVTIPTDEEVVEEEPTPSTSEEATQDEE